MESEKQPVPLEKLRPEPVLMAFAQCGTLAVFPAGRILRNDVKSQFRDRRQTFGGVLSFVIVRIFLLQSFNVNRQIIHLIEEKRVGEQAPPVDDQGG